MLPDTLYRVVVLFDLLPRVEAVFKDGAAGGERHRQHAAAAGALDSAWDADVDAWRHSRVWDAFSSKLQSRRGKGTKAQQQFEADCARFSLFRGSHPTMQAVRRHARPHSAGHVLTESPLCLLPRTQARRRMASIPGCEAALRGLTCPFVSQRLLPHHLLDPSVPAATIFADCEA